MSINIPIETPRGGRCGLKTQVYARCTGYLAPLSNWNKGKREEFKERKSYNYANALQGA